MARELCQRAGSEAVTCRFHCQSGQRIRAGAENCELPERRRAGPGADKAASKENVLDTLGKTARSSAANSASPSPRCRNSMPRWRRPLRLRSKPYNHLAWRKSNYRRSEPPPALPSAGHRTRPEFCDGVSEAGNDYYRLTEQGRAIEYVQPGLSVAGACQRVRGFAHHGLLLRKVTGELEKADKPIRSGC